MSRKSIFIVLVTLLFVTIVVSLYSTFAYDEEGSKLHDSFADNNLIYTIKDLSNKSVSIAPNTVKYVDIVLENTYQGTIRYGMYYKLLNPNKMPDNVYITKAEESVNKLFDTIGVADNKTISIKIVNNSEYNLDIVVGALVGFENGNIEELIKEGEVLIK